MVAWRGRPYPLGATWDGAGVNFALFSKHAERVELCLFDPKGRRVVNAIELRERSDFIWHGYLPEARPGQPYAYRVHGPNDPARGHRFDGTRFLLDPYARLIRGRCIVIDGAFTWGDDRRPRTPMRDTILYELHVKGFSQRHPEIPEQLRGTYAGLASEPAIEHFKRLGITAIELLPVHAMVDEKRLLQHGLRNYWGYNSIGFFAPELRYGGIVEFKTMVRRLHAAGIEVILDVVYNHTAEGDHHGPTLSFRGIDNLIYYRLDPHDLGRYLNFTGTGNSLNTAHRVVLAMVMDSLRYWVEEMHVDGFRFDLAATLARGPHGGFDRNGAFLAAVRQDPVLRGVKLFAEPWDVAEGGYQLGNFPSGWSEWNDKYRDAVRSYWKGDGGRVGELASRLSGSSDVFEPSGRGPTAGVNFVTTHDGFTLHDLVTYEKKRNEANLEDNRDGSDDNRSWNAGTDREKQKRNLLATLLFSQGVPLLLAGDEMGRTQQGNNNAYCHDSELSWVDWQLDDDARRLLEFTRQLIALRNAHPLFRRRTWFRGRAQPDPDVVWLNYAGQEMNDQEWNRSSARCLGALISGHGLGERDEHGVPVVDTDLLLLLNANAGDVPFPLPSGRWSVLVDTSLLNSEFEGTYPLQGRSLVLLSSASTPRSSSKDPSRTDG